MQVENPDAAAFRTAMREFASAVNIVTTDGPAGRRGITVSAACSVSDKPPTLLVCLNATHAGNALFLENGIFCVNTLAHDQVELSDIFAGRGDLDQDARFAHGTWLANATGAPVLSGAVASFECTITESRQVATHHVVFGAVQAIHVRENVEPLLYHRQDYRSLAE